jgi:hypothetical protein
MKIKEIKNNKLYKTFENIFIPGTYASFLLHDFLLLTNISLTILMIIELILIFGFDIDWHFFHTIDFFFGIVFLIESLLRLFYVYIPNKFFSNLIFWLTE